MFTQIYEIWIKHNVCSRVCSDHGYTYNTNLMKILTGKTFISLNHFN